MRISAGEKALWNTDVKVFWQGKAWVDKHVMKDLAVRFVRHKQEVHGDNVWVILCCDNLSAHLDADVREIFGQGKVFLCFFPPNMTNFIQPIDAGLGRSVRIKIGHHLDDCTAPCMHLFRHKKAKNRNRFITGTTSEDETVEWCIEQLSSLLAYTKNMLDAAIQTSFMSGLW